MFIYFSKTYPKNGGFYLNEFKYMIQKKCTFYTKKTNDFFLRLLQLFPVCYIIHISTLYVTQKANSEKENIFMKKLFSVLLAAVLAAGTMVLPTAAADGDIVYLQTFDNVASYDDLGWEIVETLTTNTSTYTIENGALTVDSLGGNDSYIAMCHRCYKRSIRDSVN